MQPPSILVQYLPNIFICLLQGMFDWVDILESKLDSMSPVGTDLETVKQQIEELKVFLSYGFSAVYRREKKLTWNYWSCVVYTEQSM